MAIANWRDRLLAERAASPDRIYPLKVMKELIFGGLLYLTGVMTVLAIQPKLMFTESGGWKEFGIGRNPNTHTWMPFWLFCILWAAMSYAVVSFFIAAMTSTRTTESLLDDGSQEPAIVTKPRRLRASLNVPPAGFGEMKPGTYVLNQNATRRKGVPQYKYYGKDVPMIEEQL